MRWGVGLPIIAGVNGLTDYQAKYLAHELTLRARSDSVEKLASPTRERRTNRDSPSPKSTRSQAASSFGSAAAVSFASARKSAACGTTRSTIVRILKASGRLNDFFVNPQRFMDQVAAILKNELHRLLIDGIKYERIAPDSSRAAWEMTLFDNEELINTGPSSSRTARRSISRGKRRPPRIS